METRANHVWVGVVTLILLAGAALFFVWLARLGDVNNKRYDIFFEQSVGGVARGSAVSYSGVPVGQVSDISIWEKNPEFVQVRITLDGDIPIHIGTTASVSASFTGVSTISLDGGRASQPEITCATTECPEGVPVIPPADSAFGEILASAPLLLERLATLADRLNRVLDDSNQETIAGILSNTERLTGSLADASPEIRGTMVELQGTLAATTSTLAQFEQTLGTTDQLLENEGPALAAELKQTLGAARETAAALNRTLGDVEPVTQQLSRDTLPAANATLRDLRRTSENLRSLTERIETEGASVLVGGAPLPDYEP